MAKASTELLVIDKTYELVKWACERISNFPRDRRFTLGARLENRLYDVHEGLLRAKYTHDRVQILRDVNLHLEMLRFQFRMAKDLRCMSPQSYGYASRCVNEIGRLVGSWLKKATT